MVEARPRPGDVLGCYTRSDKAARVLHWRARFSLADGIRHSLQWDAIRGRVLLGQVAT